MPIVDVEIVKADDARAAGDARALADALGRVFSADPGRTWVRLRTLPAIAYAENESEPGPAEWPVFVTVLHARPPEGAARVAETLAITSAVAGWARRPADRVHVLYAAAGAGRQAFGGRLIE